MPAALPPRFGPEARKRALVNGSHKTWFSGDWGGKRWGGERYASHSEEACRRCSPQGWHPFMREPRPMHHLTNDLLRSEQMVAKCLREDGSVYREPPASVPPTRPDSG